MSYDPGALEATLSAVAGEQATLIAELRDAFFASAQIHVSALKAARSADHWLQSALRLRSLAASFALQRVIDAAAAAIDAPCGDKRAIERIERALAALHPENAA